MVVSGKVCFMYCGNVQLIVVVELTFLLQLQEKLRNEFERVDCLLS